MAMEATSEVSLWQKTTLVEEDFLHQTVAQSYQNGAPVIVSQNDRCKYRVLRLENGLRVVLVHDPLAQLSEEEKLLGAENPAGSQPHEEEADEAQDEGSDCSSESEYMKVGRARTAIVLDSCIGN